MYTGSGTSAASNAKWPGVALTQMTADDNCAKSGTYMYEVPDGLASGAKVILSDNGSGTNRYPADMVPGMDYSGGAVSWTSGQSSLSDVTCAAP
ncbi:starch-binding protein, partial [Pseudoscardovia radai]|uniref:starch-binding protein n=1 Tax=Pseudoscardovia radai TaxID=987066 RepID=UPI003993AD6C